MDCTVDPAGRLSRRQFIWAATGLATSGVGLALAAGCTGPSLPIGPATGEPPPETTTLRLLRSQNICGAPQYVEAQELLSGEGFTDIQYVDISVGQGPDLLAAGQIDISQDVVGPHIINMDAGRPVVILAGVHVGCYELIGTDHVRAIRDLKGKTVAVPAMGSGRHVLLASMAAYVGLDPRTDINWTIEPPAEAMRLLEGGSIDALMGFPPEPQQLRARQIGHVVVSTTTDRPWSQYFCCVVAANRTFVQRHPVATKRALRAILKATDVCAREPQRVTQFLVDGGYASHYDYTLQAMQELPYDKWREYDPEDTVRFHALRLREVGMIHAAPDKIIAQGTDWHFLDELKQELKT